MSTSFDYGTGRRKTATARTRLYAGGGQIVVNDRPMEDYFPRKTLQMIIRQPLALTFPHLSSSHASRVLA